MLSIPRTATALLLLTAKLGEAAPTPVISRPQIVLSPPGQVPDAASPPIDPAFAGYAFEERSFIEYVGNGGSPNVFTRNLINAISEKTGTAPIIRVGGTSCDWSTFNPGQDEALLIPQSQQDKTIPIGMSIGSSYFDSFANLPEAQYIIDVPFVQNNLTNAVEFAKAAYVTVPKDQQFAWEIGNEPNDYERYPSSSQGPVDYVQNWANFSGIISQSFGAHSNDALFESYTGGTPITDEQELPWTVENLFNVGLNSYASSIKTVSIHYYQTESSADLQSALLNHTVTAGRANYFAAPAQYLAANHPDIPLVLGEVGSALNDGVNGTQLEAVLGSALWQIDFYLAAAAAGVRRVNFQSGVGFYYVMWQPVTYEGVPPHVSAPFYGQAFVADFIGPNVEAQTPTGSYRSSSSGSELRIRELPASRSNFSAYGAYENGTLNRLALINLQLWDSSVDSGARPATDAVLTVPSGVKTVRVELLTSTTGGLASAEGSITWGGVAWTYANNGIGQQLNNDTQVYNVVNGQVTIPVQASSAVIAYLET